jgi:hypothetical protein
MSNITIEQLIGKTAHDIATAYETEVPGMSAFSRDAWHDADMLYTLDAGAAKQWTLVEIASTSHGTIWQEANTGRYMWAWRSVMGFKYRQYLSHYLDDEVSAINIARLLAAGYSDGVSKAEINIMENRRKSLNQIFGALDDAVQSIKDATVKVKQQVVLGNTDIPE